MRRSIKPVSAAAGGFSLVEVLVALVVVSVGLLGLAKMESLALVSTSVASSRSIAAIQAASLAAAMHGNRGYWGAGRAPAVATVKLDGSGNPAITGDAGLMATVTCTTPGATACNVDNMAAYDLQQWALAVGAVLPGYLATITCNITGLPINCTISITWSERAVAINAQQTNLSSLSQPTYALYVQP